MSENELFEKASATCMVELRPVYQMNGGCFMATNSGGRKRYVIGTLDNGSVFVESVKGFDKYGD
jgi:hypothetical protein